MQLARLYTQSSSKVAALRSDSMRVVLFEINAAWLLAVAAKLNSCDVVSAADRYMYACVALNHKIASVLKLIVRNVYVMRRTATVCVNLGILTCG